MISCGSSETAQSIKERPETWAEFIEKPGLPNFHKVSDDLYRGARPEEEGFLELEKMGIKTVISLETFHSDEDEIENSGADLNYINIKMQAWNPDEEDIFDFFEIISEKENGPFFVHCKHGADRTGVMVAMYRIIEQNWTKEEAIAEMIKGGFGFHIIWDNLIEFIEFADLEQLKKRLT